MSVQSKDSSKVASMARPYMIINKTPMEFFNTSLPKLIYGANRPNSSTKSVYSGYPEVVLWDTFENELKNFQIQNDDLTLEYLIESPELRSKIKNETQINSVFTLCSSNEDGVIGQPDFAFFHNDIVKLVIEVKTIWSLTAPDNLAADYRISGPQVRLPVEQIFGYIPGDQKTSKKTSLFSRQVGHPV
ncbi:unnamed protein product [Rotaria socialis]|uniref:Uncharacterized protein n=1 Tax=Rotaria socialis TaxID=392032 RepID=A0A821WII4_9BILA|nr:unnamed protein product [Rotaria socialis]